jgi:hypothetical protein
LNKSNKLLKITGSTSNNGTYRVISASMAGSPLRTEIVLDTTALVNSGTMGSATWDCPITAIGTKDFSTELVVYPVYDSTYAFRTAFGCFYSTGFAVEFNFGASTWDLRVYVAGHDSTNIVLGKAYSAWYHILMVRKSGKLRVYVDGILVYYSAAVTGSIVGSTLVVGGDASASTSNSAASFYFNGRVARMSLWKRAVFNHLGITTGKKHFDPNMTLRLHGLTTNNP